MAVPRSFPAVETPSGGVLIFDPWIEGPRTWGATPPRARLGRIPPPVSGEENFCPLIGETIAFDFVAKGEGIRDLPHVSAALLYQPDVFGQRPNITQALAAAGPSIRVAVVKALTGGAVAGDGSMRAQLGAARISFDPTTAAWSIEYGDDRKTGDNLRHFAYALGAMPDGVLAVRLLEAFFGCRISRFLALQIHDAIDRMHPTLREVSA